MEQEILRKRKKYFYLYKITNNINKKFYYGIHCTNNLDDGYMGSGKLLHQAYKKYGVENFSKEIIQFCSSLKEVSNLEKQIVNENLINDPLCYNAIKGGYYLDEETLQHISKLNSKNQTGKNNSQFGTKWINDGERNIKIKENKLEYYLQNGWKLGRIISDNFINKMKDINSNRCWVWKDNKAYHIHKDNLQEYLNNGYIQGRSKEGIKTYIPHPETKFSWKGKVLVYDENNNKIWIDKNDPKYLSGEYISHNKGKIYVKDKQENIIGYISINDPKYLSGEYIPIREYKGTPNKIVAKDELGNTYSFDKDSEEWKSGKYKGVNSGKHWKQTGTNHFLGYKWMNDGLNQTRCSPNKFNEYLLKGWKFGKLSIK